MIAGTMKMLNLVYGFIMFFLICVSIKLLCNMVKPWIKEN